MITIRPEEPGDIDAVCAIHEKAFGQSTEAILVDSLRSACPDAISMVALWGDEVVGHILFSSVTIQSETAVTRGMWLAHMAVIPEHQRQGIGAFVQFGA